MTLPASGQISLSNVNVEAARGPTVTIDMAWISGNTKDAAKSLSALYSRAWYQRNVDGNCNNGNCNCACNCGDLNCANCFVVNCVNCANCDARPWLQSNCNCACTYNCLQSQCYTLNCNCACNA